MEREYTLEVQTALGMEEIALLQRSEGDHHFVAWHGITAVNHAWYWDSLWNDGQVTLAGLPGHGPVRHYPSDHYLRWTPEHFIQTGIEVVRHVSNGKPVTVIGHSTGGMIALGVAMAAPELVARVVLVAPVIWRDLSGIVTLWQKFANYPALGRLFVRATLAPSQLSYRVFCQVLRFYIADNQGFYGNPRFDETSRNSFARYRLTSTDAVFGTVRVLQDTDLRPAVQEKRPSMPILLVHGERDGIVPNVQSKWVAETLPNATLFPVPGTGHMVYAEKESVVNAEVGRWLARNPI